ncbi:MAG: LysO family transporter [Flavonifractor plautii]
MKDSMAAASGLGWYSLAPTLLAPYSLSVSAVAFLSNVMREIFAIITIPICGQIRGLCGVRLPARCGGHGYGVLPVVVGATHERITIYSFTSGVVLSLAVPLWCPPS